MAGPADLAPLPADQGGGTGEAIELLGRRLRAARVRRSLGVRELARQVGCSASLVSQIERGRATPSVATLVALSAALEVSLDELLDPVAPKARSGGSALPLASGLAGFPGVVLRRAERRSPEAACRVHRQLLTPVAEEGAEFAEVVFEAGPASPGSAQASRHAGREYALILEGVLEAHVGRLHHRLGPGDSLAFDASVPHRFENLGPGPVRAIWFVADRAPLGGRRR